MKIEAPNSQKTQTLYQLVSMKSKKKPSLSTQLKKKKKQKERIRLQSADDKHKRQDFYQRGNFSSNLAKKVIAQKLENSRIFPHFENSTIHRT